MPGILQQIEALTHKDYVQYSKSFPKIFTDLLMPIFITICLYLTGQYRSNSWIFLTFLPMSLLLYVRSLSKEMMNDRNNGHIQYMRINGLKRTSYITSILIMNYFRIFLIILVLTIGIIIENENILSGLKMIEIFLVMLIYGIAIIHQTLFMTILFQQPKLCSDIITIFYFVIVFICYYIVENPENLSNLVNASSYVLPQTVFIYTLKNQILDENMNKNQRFYILFGDAIIYILYYLYHEKKFWNIHNHKKQSKKDAMMTEKSMQAPPPPRLPHKLDLPKLCISTPSNFAPLIEEKMGIEEIGDNRPRSEEINSIEDIDSHMLINYSKCITLIDVTKNNPKKKDKRIDKLNLTIYEKEIFCILGHPGSGKSSLINLLSGISTPDSGEIMFYGEKTPNQAIKHRNKIGYCSQNNVLYDDLTVYENIELVARLRGINQDIIMKEVNSALAKLLLDDYRNKLCAKIDKNIKRRLALAMALLGSPKVIILDEPTLELDASSRTKIWDVLKELRQEGSTIIFATHYIEEADLCADRICLMTDSNIFAAGTPEYVRKKLGIGYKLTISALKDTYNHDENDAMEESLINEVDKMISDSIKQSEKIRQLSSDILIYIFPFIEKANIPGLLEQLELIPHLKFNLEVNTFEDAYTNLGIEGPNFLYVKDQMTLSTSDIIVNSTAMQALAAKPEYSFKSQFLALMVKNHIFTKKIMMNIIYVVIFLIFEAWSIFSSIEQEIWEIGTIIGYAQLSSIFCALPVDERQKNLTYLLKSSGCSRWAYWFANLSYHFLIALFLNIIILGMLYFKAEQFNQNLFDLGIILMCFSLGLITSSYFWGFLFTNSRQVYQYYPFFSLFFLQVFPYSILSSMLSEENSPNTILSYILISPFANFLYGISLIRDYKYGELQAIPYDYDKGFLINTGLLIFQIVIYFLFGLSLDRMKEKKRGSHRLKGINPQQGTNNIVIDPQEITNEKLRLMENNDTIRILELEKVYKNSNRPALRDVSFGVGSGQICGLVGPNGSGKTTLMKILSGLINKTSGSAKLKGIEIRHFKPELYINVGICPQEIILWESLSVIEHLRLYTNLKGIKKKAANDYISFMLQNMDLLSVAHVQAKNLSLIDKKKLMIINALTSGTDILLLDEPIDGFDNKTKRKLWTILNHVVHIRQCSVLLTSHSIREIESLCHKMIIMVNGSIASAGNIQYMKSTYRDGYEMIIKTLGDDDHVDGNINMIFPSVKKVNSLGEQALVYHLPSKEISLSKIMRMLHKSMMKSEIRDYDIYNTTINHSYIKICKLQDEDILSTNNMNNNHI